MFFLDTQRNKFPKNLGTFNYILLNAQAARELRYCLPQYNTDIMLLLVEDLDQNSSTKPLTTFSSLHLAKAMKTSTKQNK
jgi:hypothetical protein